MFKKLILTVVLVLAAAASWSQSYTISGFVQEKTSREPLTGVTIRCEKENRGTTTNNAGYFSIKLHPECGTLTFTYIGYRPIVKQFAQRSDTLLMVYMQELSATIDEVVVSAPNRAVSINERGVMSVNTKQVRVAPAFLGEPDIIKYMQMLPGVTSGLEGSSQLVVRGGSGDQSLIMLDDMPIYNQNHAYGLISIFNSDALSGAELYKGYIPEKYGGRISAVASMRMRDGNRYEHHQSLSLGTLTLGGLAEGPIRKGKGSYIVSVRRFTPDLLLRGIYLTKKSMSTQIYYSFYDINGKTTYDIGERSKLSFSIYHGKDTFSNINNSSDDGIKVSEAEARYKWGNFTSSLKMENDMGKGMFLSNSIYYSSLSNNTLLSINNITAADKNRGTTRSDLSELGYRTNLQLAADERHTLSIGADLSLLSFAPYVTTQNRNGSLLKRSVPFQDVLTASLYAGDNLIAGNLTLGMGLRAAVYNNGSNTKLSIEPRIIADYRINKHNSAYITYSRTSQPLNSYSKGYLTFPLDYWIPFEGNKISSSNQFAAGWKSSKIKWLTLSMELYYKTFGNLLYVVTPEDYLYGESAVYPSTGRAYGLELLGVYTSKRLSATLSYTYSRSLRKANGVNFPFIYDIPHNFNSYMSYTTLNNGKRNQKLALNVAWRSGMPFQATKGSYFVKGKAVEDIPMYPNTRINTYFRSDISYSFEKKMKRGRRVWQLSILNFTGYTNPYFIYKNNGMYKYTTLIPILPSFSYIRYW